MQAAVIIQKPRTAKMSVKQPTENESTSVMLVMKIATEDSDIAATMRAFKTSLDFPLKIAFTVRARLNHTGKRHFCVVPSRYSYKHVVYSDR